MQNLKGKLVVFKQKLLAGNGNKNVSVSLELQLSYVQKVSACFSYENFTFSMHSVYAIAKGYSILR